MQRLQTGYVQQVLQPLHPIKQESGLFDVGRRRSLRRASSGQPQERSTGGDNFEGAGIPGKEDVSVMLFCTRLY